MSTTRRPAAETTRRPPAEPRAPRPRASPSGRARLPASPTADAVWRYANAALEACWLIVAALVPLYVDLLRAQSSLARGQLLEVLAACMALLWLVQWAAGRRRAEDGAPAPPTSGGEGKEGSWGDTPQSPRQGSAPAPPGEDGGHPPARRQGAARDTASAAAPAPRAEGGGWGDTPQSPRQGSSPAPPGAAPRSALSTRRSALVPALFAALAAVYAGTTLLSALLSPLPAISFWGSYLRGEGALAVLGYMVLFLIVADRLRRRDQLDRLVSVLLATTLPICLYAVAQGTGHDPFAPGSAADRAAATAGNALFLAAYLIMLVPLTVWRLLDDPRRRPGAPRGSWLGPLVLAAAVVVLAGLFGAAVGRSQGWWAYPMLLAAFALVVAVLPPLPADPLGQQTRRVAYLGLLLLQLLAIVLTASRGPLAGLVIALAVVAGVSAWRAHRWRQVAVVVALVLLAGGGLLALMAPASPLRPIADSVPLLQRLSRIREDYSGARVLVWQRATETLTTPALLTPAGDPLGEARLLVGYGPEMVVYLLNRVLPPPSELGSVLGEFWDRSHNALLDRLLTTGLLGLAAYLALVVAVVLAALRRAWPTPAPFGWSLGFALAVALLAHLAESQTSLLGLPPEAIFWLLAGVAVAASSPDAAWAAAPAAPVAAPGRSDRRGSRSAPAAPPRAAAPTWVVGAYAAVAVVVALVLLQVPSVEAVLVATVLAMGAVLAAPLVGALALAPPPAGASAPPRGATARALGAIGLASVLALAAGSHQATRLAAEVAFHRAELAQQAGNFPGAIRSAQAALGLTPEQAEYYHILGQYYGALAGETRASPRADFAPSLAAARGEPAPERLGRDQLFALGRVSLEEAIRRNPFETRYYATLGELYRYWADVAGQPEHLAAAVASFEQAAALKPNDVEVHAGLADSMLLAGDAVRALAEGQRAEALLPGYWYAYDVTARAALATGDATTALVAAGDALQYATANAGVKAPSAFELDRLRQVVAQAVASGASPVHPGAVLRSTPSGTVYRIDEQGQARVLPPALAAGCADLVRGATPLPDPILPLLPAGPELTGC